MTLLMFDLISPLSDVQTFIERLQNHREIQKVHVDRITSFQISKKVTRNTHIDLEGHSGPAGGHLARNNISSYHFENPWNTYESPMVGLNLVKNG